MTPALKPGSASELLKRLREVSKNHNVGSMEFAQILYLLHEMTVSGGKGGLRVLKGYGTWRQFVEREVQIHIRQAERYIAVWEHFGVRLGRILGDKLNDPPAFSLLRVLMRFTNEDNIKHWWKKVRTMTFMEVAQEADRVHRQSQKNPLPRKGDGACFQFSVAFTASELRKMERALDTVRTFEAFTRKGALLSVIVSEWVSLQP